MNRDFLDLVAAKQWDRRARFRRPWAARVRYETELLLEDHAWAGTPIYPAANANNAYYTGTVDMSKYNRVQFLIACGTVGATGNTLFQLQQTNNANGQSNTNVAVTNSGTATFVTINTSSQGATIECRADQLTQRYAQLGVVVGDGPSTFCVIPNASEARQHPTGKTSADDPSITSGNRVYA